MADSHITLIDPRLTAVEHVDPTVKAVGSDVFACEMDTKVHFAGKIAPNSRQNDQIAGNIFPFCKILYHFRGILTISEAFAISFSRCIVFYRSNSTPAAGNF